MEQKNTFTHCLILDFICVDESNRQTIIKTFGERLHGRKRVQVFGPNDSINITWSKGEDCTFWATSRLAKTYIRQMTKDLLFEVCKEVRIHLKLNINTCQVSAKVIETKSGVIGIVKEEAPKQITN